MRLQGVSASVRGKAAEWPLSGNRVQASIAAKTLAVCGDIDQKRWQSMMQVRRGAALYTSRTNNLGGTYEPIVPLTRPRRATLGTLAEAILIEFDVGAASSGIAGTTDHIPVSRRVRPRRPLMGAGPRPNLPSGRFSDLRPSIEPSPVLWQPSSHPATSDGTMAA